MMMMMVTMRLWNLCKLLIKMLDIEISSEWTNDNMHFERKFSKTEYLLKLKEFHKLALSDGHYKGSAMKVGK